MSAIAEIASVVQADWGWIAVGVFTLYQIYWPIWATKFQTFTTKFSSRLENIEVTQVAIAQEVEGVSDERVMDLHERDDVEPSDLKNNGSSRPIPTDDGRPN